MSDDRTVPGSGAPERYAEFLRRRAAGEDLLLEDLCRDHPELADELRALDASASALHGASAPRSGNPSSDSGHLAGLLERLRAQGPQGTRYSIQGEIARGGMGAILEVRDEDLRRTLAMKVVLGEGSPGAGGSQGVDPRLLGRFLEEAQITGQLEHPGVVPVHELGLGEDGRVYFTMRLVQGDDLRVVFDKVARGEDGWNRTRALGVLLKVCETMAYAHSQGVIHRDLKPANVMVGNFGEVYVMDWGVARVLGAPDLHDPRSQPGVDGTRGGLSTVRDAGRLTPGESSLVTLDGDIMGTPSYMPPEQARGQLERLGTWSDVYALGAMLYQVLTGHMPYNDGPGETSPHDVLSGVLEGPPRPVEQLAPGAAPELVAICDKAMARDPQHRYPDTQALADDLRAYLEQRVVAAYETGALAEARQWVRRNRPLATALAASVLIAIGGALAFAIKARQATRSAQAARQASLVADRQARLAKQSEEEALASQRRAERVTEFVQRSLVGSDPNAGGDQGRLVVEAMEAAARELEAGSLAEDPETEASLQLTIARILNGNGRPRRALVLASQALATLERLHPGDHARVAEALHEVGIGQRLLHDGPAAIESNQAALEMYQRLYPGDRVEVALTMGDLAESLNLAGRVAEALPWTETALAMLQRLAPGDDANVATMLQYRASHFMALGRVVEALPVYEEALAMRRRLLPGDDPLLAASLNDTAHTLFALGRVAEARASFEDAMAMYQRLFEGDHPSVATVLNNLALCEQRLGDRTRALELLRSALEIRQRVFPGDDAEVAQSLSNIGSVLLGLGRAGEALEQHEAALEMRLRLFEGDHPELASSISNVGACLFQLGRKEDALASFEDAYAMTRRLLPGDHPTLGTMLNNLGKCALQLGEPESALEWLEEGLRMHERLFGEQSAETCDSLQALALCLRTLDRQEEALAHAERAAAIAEQLPAEHPLRTKVRDTLRQLGGDTGDSRTDR